MKRVLILAEGQTEERFVKDILNPSFELQNICLTPTIVSTKIVKSGGRYKGGWVSYKAAKRDLLRLLGDTNAVAVTTMFDFYGLPGDFPLWPQTGTCYQKVEAAEQSFTKDVNHRKFIPYLQLHEFEGLLFSSPQTISDTLISVSLSSVQEIRNRFSSPEEINLGIETHPSKRLTKLYPSYMKPVYGSLIANRIGLATIRNNCRHFNQWVEKIMAL